MTSLNLTKELLRLSTAEKIELVEELWDSIPEDDEALAQRSSMPIPFLD